MAGEIRTPHPSSTTGLTLYALLWDSTSQVCTTSGVTFGAYATANLANYDIALTEKGTASRFYAGDMPAAAAGTYLVTIYERAGGAPAEGDFLIATQIIEWSGTVVISLYSRLAPTTAGRTLDVSSGGEAGLDWANIGSPTTSNTLSSTTIGTVSSVSALAANIITSASIHIETGLRAVRSNTAAGGAAGSITLDASASSTTDDYKYASIVITGGTGSGQRRICTAYNGTTKVATVTPNWVTQPAMGTSTFAVLNEGVVDKVSQVATAQTARDIGASVLLSSGTGTGQVKLSSGYVAPNWGDVGNPTTTVGLTNTTVGVITAYTGNTVQTGDSYAIVNSGTHGNAALKTLIDAVDDLVDTEVGAIKAKTDFLPSATAGAAGGVFIAGSNAPVTISGSGDALTLTSTGGNGHGLYVAGNGTGDGAHALGGATGAGIKAEGQGAYPGILSMGGATGAGIQTFGGATSGHGLYAFAQGVGDGINGLGGTGGGAGMDLSTPNGAGLKARGTGTGNDLDAPDTLINWNAAWDAEVQSEVQDAIEVNHLDHLFAVADPGGAVANSSLWAAMTSKSATPAYSSYVNTTDSLEAQRDNVGTAGAGLTAADDAVITAIAALSIPTAAQNAAALMDLSDGIEVGLTPRQAMRLIAAALAGELSGAATTTIVIRNAVADSKDRITATVDSSGNRSALTLDLT